MCVCLLLRVFMYVCVYVCVCMCACVHVYMWCVFTCMYVSMCNISNLVIESCLQAHTFAKCLIQLLPIQQNYIHEQCNYLHIIIIML